MSAELVRLYEAGGLEPEEELALRERLWRLLARQVARATQGDSSSLRMEEAEELLASLGFTLRLAQQAEGRPIRALLTDDLDERLHAGQRLLEEQTRLAARELEAVRLTLPEFANCSLRDTLRGLTDFFRRYDFRLYAHQIPADPIDYQLCQPVPEMLAGVCYIRAYLRQLLTENRLLACYPPARERTVLQCYYGDYETPLVNLYEPIAACAVGAELLGLHELRPLHSAELAAFFAPLDARSAARALKLAAESVCARLQLKDDASRVCLANWVETLWPRIREALPAGALNGAFPCFQ